MDTAIIVVHGVGDPLPGDALGALVEGISGTTDFRETQPRTIESRVVPGDKTSGSPRVSTYPMHKAVLVRTSAGSDEPSTLYLREVYWGDLSRLKGSAAAFVYALFDLIFGLRHIIFAAQEDASRIVGASHGMSARLVKWGNWFSTVALWMARGPMLALNILATAVVLLYVMLLSLFAGGHWHSIAAASVGALGVALAGLLLRRSLKSRQWSQSTADWMLLLGTVALILVLAVMKKREENLDPFINGITPVMSVGAVLMAFSVFISVIANLGAISFHSDPLLRRPLTVVNFCTALSIGLFVFVVMVAWTVIRRYASPSVDLADRIEKGLHLFPLVWGSFGVVALVFLCIVFLNWILEWQGSQRPRHRYIVSPAVVLGFLVASFFYAALFVPLAFLLERDQFCKLNDIDPCWVGAWQWGSPFNEYVNRVETYKKATLALSGALVALVLASRAHFLTALDLVLDVMAHFRTEEGKGRVLGFGVAGTTGGTRSRRNLQWEAMVDRFWDVLENTISETGAKNVVVVSHSQGTTIALNGLGLLCAEGDRTKSLRTLGAQISLITMGCPVDHLYRHYMPMRYVFNTGTNKVVTRWCNIFRRDDFIGTSVVTGKLNFPENHPVGPRGHTDYWRDREVLDGHLIPFLNRRRPTCLSDKLAISLASEQTARGRQS